MSYTQAKKVRLCELKCKWGTEIYIMKHKRCSESHDCSGNARGDTAGAANCALATHGVDLPQDGSLSEEQRLACVHQDEVKVGLPGPVGCSGLSHTHTHTLGTVKHSPASVGRRLHTALDTLPLGRE